MHRMITSKEELLAAARTIVHRDGLDALNIRALAQYCGIATGSVYNYFTSKSELLVAMAEDYWRSVFHPQLLAINRQQPFVCYLEQLYGTLVTHLGDFRSVYGGGLGEMEAEQRQQGRIAEQQYIVEICNHLVWVLRQDKQIPPQIWTADFTPEQFARLVFDNLQILVMQRRTSCTFLQELVRRLIYPAGENTQ